MGHLRHSILADFGVHFFHLTPKCPEDKPYIESFNSSYKTEEIYRNEYRNFQEAKIGWETYREWYRNDRLHQSLDYMSPVQYAQRAQKYILLVA